MGIVDAIAIWVGGFVVVAMGVWCLYTLIVVSDKAKEDKQNELPYKVDPPHTITTVDVAIPPIKREGAVLMFDPMQQPKRPYIKRSKYWTDKRKKAAAKKARKTKRKSK